MGVADNKTYRDQYHFKDDFSDTQADNPSVKGPDKINTTIKENPYRSNVEIEGGELVLQPDLSALFKAQGKKHSGGGMDVLLKPESFIFSDFKDLAISEKEKERFELKMGGSTSPTKNTPAEVVKKNVNVKHYNTLINNISDPYKDELARKSSAMMLEKYIATLGNIAYIQENKKKFPDGLPAFSLGTAPVFDPEKVDDIDESKQYAKYGGTVYSTGGAVDAERCPCGGKYPNCTPCTPAQIEELLKKAPKGTIADAKGMAKIGTKDMTDLYHVGTDPTRTKIKPGMTNQQWINYLKTESPERKARRLASYKNAPGTDKLLQVSNPLPTRDECECGYDRVGNCIPCDKKPQPNPFVPQPTPTEVTGKGFTKRADWEFTPWQKISQLYNWGQYANVQRYMPFRSRYNATYADPTLLNPEQTIGDIKGTATQSIAGLNSLNPIMRNAQASQFYGEALNQIPGVRSQYDNANAQISNQFAQYNNQVRNNESMVNMQNDQMYYQQAVEGRKNFNNARTFAANNAMNNVLGDVQTNQALAYNLLTLDNPVYGMDWKGGDALKFYPKDIRDVQSTNTTDVYTDFFEELNNASTPEEIQKLQIKERLLRQKNILPYLQQRSNPNPFTGKKGGKVPKNPYK